MSDEKQDRVRWLLTVAARTLEPMDPDRHAGWLLFWCELLDDSAAQPCDCDAILRELRDALDERLEQGVW